MIKYFVSRSLMALGSFVVLTVLVSCFLFNQQRLSAFHQWLNELALVPSSAVGSAALPDNQHQPLLATHQSLSASSSPPAQPLSKDQERLVQWLSKKYSVALEPMTVIVKQAFQTGQQLALDPALLLAVTAVDSSFNPFASRGVLTKNSGLKAALDNSSQTLSQSMMSFDPIHNLKNGAKVLLNCITTTGSVEAGLEQYAKTSVKRENRDYVGKVLVEHQHLAHILLGRHNSNAPTSYHRPSYQ